MTTQKNRGLGRCDATKASMLKALLARGTPQDLSAWLVGVNGGRANDVLHGRLFADIPAANDNELKAYLEASADRFQRIAGSI